MGMLVDGQWTTKWYVPDKDGRFVRSKTRFRSHISDDGSTPFAATSGRYHLYVSNACPWAHRTLIVRKLRGLEDDISVTVVDPMMLDKGWVFSDAPGSQPDPLFGFECLHQIYTQADPQYTGRVTVPVLWDKVEGTIVNNESIEIVRMFDTAMMGLGDPEVCFYPQQLASEIDQTIAAIYEPINNGVYKAGFATTQKAYEEAATALFEALEHWDGVLGQRRYLCGDVVTEADWCLFTTLVRFDPVYHTHFKCSRRRIVDFPNVWPYLRSLYQIPGVAQTVNMDHIRQHYYRCHTSINPHAIVAQAPEMDLMAPHSRHGALG